MFFDMHRMAPSIWACESAVRQQRGLHAHGCQRQCNHYILSFCRLPLSSTCWRGRAGEDNFKRLLQRLLAVSCNAASLPWQERLPSHPYQAQTCLGAHGV